MTILELKQGIYKENEVTADGIREELKKQGKLLINIMSLFLEEGLHSLR